MRFSELLATAGVEARVVGDDAEVDSVWADSRRCGPGSCFVAVRGWQADGNAFIAEAVAAGASAVVCQDDSHLPGEAAGKVPVAVVADAHETLGLLSQAIHGWPGRSLTCVGITGTNGKSTVAHITREILTAAGHRTAMLGTISYQTGSRARPAPMTSPPAEDLAAMMAEMVSAGVTHLVMETSSHALHQKRTAGVDFRVGVFTNLTGDHLDYHGSMENYLGAKRKLFAGLGPGARAVINRQDPYAEDIAKATAAEICWYDLDEGDCAADLRARIISADAGGTVFDMVSARQAVRVETPLIGRYNVLNCLASAGACMSLGVSLETIAYALGRMSPVPGRLQRVDGGGDFQVFVDYAHTDDALENVLRALKPICQGKLIVMFGCGGDRDKTKRPRMARVAAKLADSLVITSDNPRGENPQQIIDDILAGLDGSGRSRTAVLVDRRQAIARAIELAAPGDIVLLAGKGHENYQIIAGERSHFDDVEEAGFFLANREQ